MECILFILDINPDQQRISLGLKQTEEDPWANINDLYKVGDIVKGKGPVFEDPLKTIHDIEYWYLDWYDGSCINVPRNTVSWDICSWYMDLT